MARFDLEEARELAYQFHQEVSGFTLQQINMVWRAFSETRDSDWVTPEKELVKSVFDEVSRAPNADLLREGIIQNCDKYQILEKFKARL